MKYQLELREEAKRLRQKGFSLKEIAEKLKIAKSTASVWLRDIILDSKVQKRLKERQLLGQYKTIQIKKAKREKLLSYYKKEALKQISQIKFSRKIYKLLCALLFWCEGGKNTQSHVQFINSEPLLIKTFVSLLRSAFEIDEKKFRVLMHLHEYHNEEKQKKFWSETTGIPETQFTKTYWKPHTKKRERNGYQGCVRVSYYDAHVARQLHSWYNAFAEEQRGVR